MLDYWSINAKPIQLFLFTTKNNPPALTSSSIEFFISITGLEGRALLLRQPDIKIVTASKIHYLFILILTNLMH